MSKYELVIYWSNEDSAFIVEVPELPGCMADGATYQEAVANAERVIGEWVETATDLGRSIPEPRGRLLYALSTPCPHLTPCRSQSLLDSNRLKPDVPSLAASWESSLQCCPTPRLAFMRQCTMTNILINILLQTGEP